MIHSVPYLYEPGYTIGPSGEEPGVTHRAIMPGASQDTYGSIPQ